MALSFDADQTLWDFRGVQQRALALTIEAMIERGDIDAGTVDVDELQHVRDEVVGGFRGRPHSLEDVRRLSFQVYLERVGHRSPHNAAEELLRVFLGVRFGEIRLYPEVRPALERLKRRFPIGLLSNGNTYPDRCGLPDTFDAIVFGPGLGFGKPDPRAFAAIAAELGVQVESLLHVGDDWDDIEGANAVGATSVHISRAGSDPALGSSADHQIHDLTELDRLLDGLELQNPNKT